MIGIDNSKETLEALIRVLNYVMTDLEKDLEKLRSATSSVSGAWQDRHYEEVKELVYSSRQEIADLMCDITYVEGEILKLLQKLENYENA